MFEGGLVYAKETKANPLPTLPKKDDKFHDLNDAVGYAVLGATENISDAGLRAPVGSRTPFRTVERKRSAARPSTIESRGMVWGRRPVLGRLPRAGSGRSDRSQYWRRPHR